MSQKKSRMSRRSFFINTGAAAAAVASLGNFAKIEDYEAVAQNVKTFSQPSDLKITDLRTAGRFVRIYTNQGIIGHGEIRDGSSTTYVLMLKHLILGENPLNVDKIWRKVKQFGFHARQSGGPVPIEEACWDIAGKAWGVPCWQMLGGKFRDKILVYCDTPRSNDPVAMGNRLKERMGRGFKFLKMDIGIQLCDGIEGCITRPPVESIDSRNTEHPFTGITITDKGTKVMADYTADVREIIGYEIPLATDHFGHLVIESCIKLAQALDPYNLAWLEDMVPWFYTDQYVRLKNSCRTPILTGEDIYCKEEFLKLFRAQAISICQPDLATSGGMLETKKIGDLAQEHGIAMAMHMAGSVVTLYSTIHCAAATENFMVTEHHGVDREGYDDTAVGVTKPIIQDGYIPVPDGPGLGIELNDDAIKNEMERSRKRGRDPGGFFEPTTEWDDRRLGNTRLWSMYIKEKKTTENMISYNS